MYGNAPSFEKTDPLGVLDTCVARSLRGANGHYNFLMVTQYSQRLTGLFFESISSEKQYIQALLMFSGHTITPTSF